VCYYPKNYNNIVSAVILDSSDLMVGHLQLVVEFAIVSATPYEYSTGWNRTLFDTDCPNSVHYRVLALDSDNQIAERVGHGAISQRASTQVTGNGDSHPQVIQVVSLQYIRKPDMGNTVGNGNQTSGPVVVVFQPIK
jgi:hypothetical protein